MVIEEIHRLTNNKECNRSSVYAIPKIAGTSAAIPTWLRRADYLLKKGSKFTWNNEKPFDIKNNIKAVTKQQVKSTVKSEATRKEKAEKVSSINQTKLSLPSPVGSIKDFLEQLPIGSVVDFIKSKGYIVLIPKRNANHHRLHGSPIRTTKHPSPSK